MKRKCFTIVIVLSLSSYYLSIFFNLTLNLRHCTITRKKKKFQHKYLEIIVSWRGKWVDGDGDGPLLLAFFLSLLRLLLFHFLCIKKAACQLCDFLLLYINMWPLAMWSWPKKRYYQLMFVHIPHCIFLKYKCT